MNNSLLPCPFCGGKARVMLEEEDRPDECFHNIYCTSCGVQFWVKSKSEAIAAWNRRTEQESELPASSTPTNAQRIRSMSDAQHARFLVHVVSDGCPPDMDWDCQKDKGGWDACDKCWENWLQQPAETEGTE